MQTSNQAPLTHEVIVRMALEPPQKVELLKELRALRTLVDTLPTGDPKVAAARDDLRKLSRKAEKLNLKAKLKKTDQELAQMDGDKILEDGEIDEEPVNGEFITKDSSPRTGVMGATTLASRSVEPSGELPVTYVRDPRMPDQHLMRRELNKKQELLRVRGREIAASNGRIHDLRAVIDGQQGRIELLKANVADRDLMIQQRGMLVSEHEFRIASYKKTMGEKDQRVKEQLDRIGSLETKVTELEDEQNIRKEQAETIATRNTQNRLLREIVRQHEQKIAEQETSLKYRGQELDRLTSLAKAQNRTIQELQTVQQEMSSTISSLQQTAQPAQTQAVIDHIVANRPTAFDTEAEAQARRTLSMVNGLREGIVERDRMIVKYQALHSKEAQIIATQSEAVGAANKCADSSRAKLDRHELQMELLRNENGRLKEIMYRSACDDQAGD